MAEKSAFDYVRDVIYPTDYYKLILPFDAPREAINRQAVKDV